MEKGKGNSYILDKEFSDIIQKTYYGNFSGNLLELNSNNNRLIMVSSVLGLGAGLYLRVNPLLSSILGGVVGLIISNIK
jgi:hypothetical protein|tara:strand:- start:6578 stop:6814 length:237 start_codon:yes stop_codon:yes gene_type:complete